MFANRVTKKITLTGDDGDPVEVFIRKLSPRSLFKAAEAKTIAIVQGAQKFGAGSMEMFGDSMKEAIASAAAAKKDAPVSKLSPEEQRKARFGEYDRESILLAGIVSWTATEILNPDSVAELDEETQALLSNEILELTIPPVDDIPKG